MSERRKMHLTSGAGHASVARRAATAARLLTAALVATTCALAVAILLLTMGTYSLAHEIGLCGVLVLGPMFGGMLAIGIVVALDNADRAQPGIRTADVSTVVFARITDELISDPAAWTPMRHRPYAPRRESRPASRRRRAVASR